MDQGDLCLCLHTREVHIEHGWCTAGCSCKGFALIDAGVDLLEAVRVFVHYMEHAGDKSITRKSLAYPLHLAEAAIRKARS